MATQRQNRSLAVLSGVLERAAQSLDSGNGLRIQIRGSGAGGPRSLTQRVSTPMGKRAAALVSTVAVAISATVEFDALNKLFAPESEQGTYVGVRDLEFTAAHGSELNHAQVLKMRQLTTVANARNKSLLSWGPLLALRDEIEKSSGRTVIVFDRASADAMPTMEIGPDVMNSKTAVMKDADSGIFCAIAVGGSPTLPGSHTGPDVLFNASVVAHEMTHCIDDDSVPSEADMGPEGTTSAGNAYRWYEGEARADAAAAGFVKLAAGLDQSIPDTFAQFQAQKVVEFLASYRLARWQQDPIHSTFNELQATNAFFTGKELDHLVHLARSNSAGLKAAMHEVLRSTKLAALRREHPELVESYEAFSSDYVSRMGRVSRYLHTTRSESSAAELRTNLLTGLSRAAGESLNRMGIPLDRPITGADASTFVESSASISKVRSTSPAKDEGTDVAESFAAP